MKKYLENLSVDSATYKVRLNGQPQTFTSNYLRHYWVSDGKMILIRQPVAEAPNTGAQNFAGAEGVQLERSIQDRRKTILTAVIQISKDELRRCPELEGFILRRLTIYDLLTKELTKVEEKIKSSEKKIWEEDGKRIQTSDLNKNPDEELKAQ